MNQRWHPKTSGEQGKITNKKTFKISQSLNCICSISISLEDVKLGQHWDILGWEYWDKNHWKRVWSCCRIFWVWDNLLWISNFSFSRSARRFDSIKFYFLAELRQPLCALCCCRCLSLAHHRVLGTLSPDFLAPVGSQTIHGSSSHKNWSHCSRLCCTRWRKTEKTIYHLNPQVREKRKALPLSLFYSSIISTSNPENSPSKSWKSDFSPILLKIFLDLMSKLNWWKLI